MEKLNLDQVTTAVFVCGDTTYHPCGECTLCTAPIVEGTRYTTWELTAPDKCGLLEHICMECDWVLRNRIANGRINNYMTNHIYETATKTVDRYNVRECRICTSLIADNGYWGRSCGVEDSQECECCATRRGVATKAYPDTTPYTIPPRTLR